MSDKVVSSIERESFTFIEVKADLSAFTSLESEVVARIIHASADFSYAKSVHFSPNAIESGIAALTEGAPVVTDVTMVSAAITGLPTVCALTAFEEREAGRTRSFTSMTRAAMEYGSDAIYVVGCSPTSLFALLELENQISPPLIIGMPVGFVGAAESKDALISSQFPFISNRGNKGGSAVAGAACNSLIYLAKGERRLFAQDRGPLE